MLAPHTLKPSNLICFLRENLGRAIAGQEAGFSLFALCLPFFASCVWCYVAFFQKINKIQKLCDFYARVHILDAKCKMKP